MEIFKGDLLQGRRALVCGASQGIGAASARALAKMGAQVVLLSRNQAELEKVRSSLIGEGHQVCAVDLSDTNSIESKIKEFLPIHIVVNNSGGPKGGPLAEAKPNEFLAAMNQHLVAAHVIAQIVLPGMKAAHFGRFVQIISTSVKAPIQGLAVSNTIRGAVANWAKSLANEVGPFGVTVNNVLPGYTKTPRFESLRKATAEKTQTTEAHVEDQWRHTIPLKRFAEPEEVAAAVAFLASPAASYISGINLPVDGGRTPSL